jgi:uncharacterized protein (DUF1499 family)
MALFKRYWAVIPFLLACAFWGATTYGGPFGFWGGLARLGGQGADWGPVNFERLRLRGSPNDALICPEKACPLVENAARAPILSIAAAQLQSQIIRYVLDAPNAAPLKGSDENRLRYVQYSRWLRFPDIVDIEIVPIDGDHATLAVYSRSVFGYGDMGVNKARINQLLDKLTAGAPISG